MPSRPAAAVPSCLPTSGRTTPAPAETATTTSRHPVPRAPRSRSRWARASLASAGARARCSVTTATTSRCSSTTTATVSCSCRPYSSAASCCPHRTRHRCQRGTSGATPSSSAQDKPAGPGVSTRHIAGGTSDLRSSGALGVVAIPAAELLHPACRVQDARLPGVERVARRRDLDVDDGIGTAVLPGDSSLAGGSRPGEEGEVRRPVAENDQMVVGVDSLLHNYRSSRNSTWRPITGSYLRMTRRSGSFLRLLLVTYV